METHSPPVVSTTSDDLREYRRLRAWHLACRAWPQHQIAEALGVSQSAVSQWLAKARQGGRAALRKHPPPGRPARLTDAQRAQLPGLLAHGAEYWGFRGDLWTRARVGQVLEDQFGVRYSLGHLSRLLAQIGWSRQRPARRARQQREKAVLHWQTERLPALQAQTQPASPQPTATELTSPIAVSVQAGAPEGSAGAQPVGKKGA